ncbi:MAG: hypothetical protein HY776_07400 [Actinobacteria bacterium]|nr:hypothetical protein [Actinomycetota bacterium]
MVAVPDVKWIIAAIFSGAGFWLWMYTRQRLQELEQPIIKAPKWIAWFCGNPLGNYELELKAAILQLTGVLMVLAAIPLGFIGSIKLRVLIIGTIFLSGFMGGIIVPALIRFLNPTLIKKDKG